MINWKIRFTANNKAFISRLLASVLLPILVYYGMEFKDVTSWQTLWEVGLRFFSNPYLIALTIFNVLNVIPDPTTKGLGDSEQALSYIEPK